MGLFGLLPSHRLPFCLCTTRNSHLPSPSSRCCPLPFLLPNNSRGCPLLIPLAFRLGYRRPPRWIPLLRDPRFRSPRASVGRGGGVEVSAVSEDLGRDGEVFRKTLRLVECAMFASVSALAYLLSNSLALEVRRGFRGALRRLYTVRLPKNYLGCFFALPIVISSMRWGLAAGRKTMVATAVLLLTLAGPVKAATYLLMHGFLGFAMGSLWRSDDYGNTFTLWPLYGFDFVLSCILFSFTLFSRLQTNWGLSIALCSLVRALGAVGFVLVSSFLIRENILSLITINMHATLAYMCSSIGISVPTMGAIYVTFGVLLMINCGFLVFLLHILYAVFLSKFGMKDSLRLPRWMEQAI